MPANFLITSYFIRYSDQCVLVYQDGVILLAQPDWEPKRGWHSFPGTLYAFDAADGKLLWKHPYGGWAHNWQPDVFAVDGKVERRFSTNKTLQTDHHHRCYRAKATERFFIASRRGAEFINYETGHNSLNHWARGACLHGFVPCNGMLYLTPNPCICYLNTKLNGYYALAPKSDRAVSAATTNSAAFERGPAYRKLKTVHDWPTFRHDASRSGSTGAFVSHNLDRSWDVTVGGKLTPPVVAGGKVFVASIDEHRVVALSEDNGKDGRKLSEYDLEGSPVYDGMAATEGRVFVAMKTGKVVCFKAAGDVVRTVEPTPAPAHARNTCFRPLTPYSINGSPKQTTATFAGQKNAT